MTSKSWKSIGVLMLALSSLSMVSSARAEYLGLLHGRSADVARMPTLSVDSGVTFANDYAIYAVRANYKLTPIFMVYGSIGLAEDGRADGIPVGIGAQYTLENLLSRFDTGIKLSYQRASFEIGDDDFDASNLAFEFLISTQLGYGPRGNIDFYANTGIQYLDFGPSDDVELSIGGGAIMPIGPGEIFVGLDYVDDAMFGGGFRLFF